jgi:hypothetical protein
MIYLDTETVGLTGPCVLIQLAGETGPVSTVHVLGSRAGELRQLLDDVCKEEVCGFNLTFDWFQLTRLYNLLLDLPNDAIIGADHLAHLGRGRQVLRPRSALDLMLHARSGPMQALMERDDIRVRRVPAVLAEALCSELTARLDLPKIFFARRSDGACWKVEHEPDDPDFPDVYLPFGASGRLKPLAAHLLGVETIDYPIPDHLRYNSEPWDVRPLVKTLGSQHAAQRVIMDNHEFWRTNSVARRYAEQDVELLRQLRAHWGNPPAGDDNSVLACAVGACRAVGYPIDPLRAYDLHVNAVRDMQAAPRAPGLVKQRLLQLCDPIEALAIEDTTGETLEAVAKWGDHPAARLAKAVIRARTAEKRADLLLKLLTVGHAPFDFKVVGALSNRMSGGSGINPQGIEKGEVREVFPMVEGGDFSAFEVCIADAVYADENLHADLLSGKKIHALFGAAMYNESYDTVKASEKADARIEGKGWDGNLYDPAKHGVFAWIYGAQDQKLSETLRLDLDETAAGVARFFQRYPKLQEGRTRDQHAFCSMTQPRGIGTRVVWRDPADYVESLFGFRRYFTLENRMCRVLFDLAQDLPPSMKGLEKAGIRVKRRDRLQTLGGAARSALFAAAFQIQARNMRAAGNHRIQSTGASITKGVQRALWELQPVGAAEPVVMPLNVHDELVTPVARRVLVDTVQQKVDSYRSVVPLLKIDWKTGLSTWGDIK